MNRKLLRNIAIAAAAVVVSGGIAFAVIFFALRPAGQGSGPRTGVATSPYGRAAGSVAAGVSTGTATGTATGTQSPSGGYTIESTLPPGVTATPKATRPNGGDAASAQPLPRIAYVRDRKLYVADEDGKDELLVTKWKAGGNFHLSPDRRSIAYTVPATSGPTLLLYEGQVGGRMTRIEDVVKGTDFAWSPNGKLIAADVVGIGGPRAEKRLGTVRLGGFGGTSRFGFEGSDPAFSPNGRRLLFLHAGSPGGPVIGELWIVGTDGKGAFPLIPGRAAVAAAWLGDNDVIAILVGTGNEPDQLVRIRADGAQLKVLATSAGTELRSLNHVLVGGDGGRIAYDVVGDDGYSRIYTVGPDGQGLHLLPGGRDAYPLAWSLDGDRLFYVEGNATQGEPTAVVSASPQGTGKRFVVMGGGF